MDEGKWISTRLEKDDHTTWWTCSASIASSLVHALPKRIPAWYRACSVHKKFSSYSMIYQTYIPIIHYISTNRRSNALMQQGQRLHLKMKCIESSKSSLALYIQVLARTLDPELDSRSIRVAHRFSCKLKKVDRRLNTRWAKLCLVRQCSSWARPTFHVRSKLRRHHLTHTVRGRKSKK